MAKLKKVRHIKTKRAKVSIKLRGRAIEVTVLIPRDLAEQLTYRMAAPSRFPEPRKKRQK